VPNASPENTFLWWMLRAQKSNSAPFLEIPAKIKKLSEIKLGLVNLRNIY